MHKLITIDGPAGVGKGTICKLLSKSLDAPVLNSGEIYRSIAHDIKENHINPEDVASVITHVKNFIALTFVCFVAVLFFDNELARNFVSTLWKI